MLDEGDCIVKQGYLKKIKTMKKKYFVLYRDSRTGPARLEYYDTEKKFREKKSGQAARRAIMLRSCFAISDTCDSRQKHGIALYTKDDCFGVGFGDAAERDEWLTAMHTLVGSGRRGGGDPRAPMFEHVWDVNVRPRDLGKSFTGQYRLCLNVRNISLVKKASVEPDVTFPLEVVRRCGHSDNFFFIEVGRQAGSGQGELWMEAEDALIAQNMHYAILLAMNSNKDYDDLPPRIVPQQCMGSSIAVVGSLSSVPQRSNSHSTDSRISFMQSRTAGYDVAARGAGIRPQRSYTFSEPKRPAAAGAVPAASTQAALISARTGLGAFAIGGTKQASHRPNSTVPSGGGSGSGGGYLGQDLLDRNGSGFCSRGRSDSVSSRATSSSLSIDDCDQGLASRSLTPDLQLAAGMQYLQPCGTGEAAATDRRSPNFGGSTVSVHSSRGQQGPAFECPRNNASSSASSLSGGSVDDPYLDMTPGNGGGSSVSPSSLRPGGAQPAAAAALAYVTMAPCITANRGGGGASSDAYAPMTPPASASRNQEGYVEMCPAASPGGGGGGLSRCNSSSSGSHATASRPVRPDTVRSYVRECGSDEISDHALSRRSSVASQLAAAAATPSSANSNPYVEMSCSAGSSSSKLQLPYAATAGSAASSGSVAQMPGGGGTSSGASTPRSIPSVCDAGACSSPRGTLAPSTQWHDRLSNSGGGGSVASLHDFSQHSPRVATPFDLSKPGTAGSSSSILLQLQQQLQQQQQVDLFMEMDFDRPRTASDTFCNRPRTHSFSASAAHRPRSSSHGQSSRHRAAAAARAGSLGGQLVTSAPPSVGAASSAGSSRDSSLLGSSGYLDVTASSAAGPTSGGVVGSSATSSSAGYMEMSFDDRKSQAKSRQQHHHQAPQLRSHHQVRSSGASGLVSSHQLTVTVPPPISSGYAGAAVAGRRGSSAASSQESLEAAAGCGRRCGGAPLSPGDYVGIDFSRGFEHQPLADSSTSSSGDCSAAAISPILLRSNLGLGEQLGRPGGGGSWDMAEPFPELSGSSSGEDVNSCRQQKRQQQQQQQHASPRPSPASSVTHSRSNSCTAPRSSQQQLQQSRTGGARASPPHPVTASALLGGRAATAASAAGAPPDAAVRLPCAAVVDDAMVSSASIAATSATSDCYEEMGPHCFGRSGDDSSLSLSTTADNGDDPSCVVPQKGFCYVRLSSRDDACECMPRRAVCYIRPEPRPADDARSSTSSSDDDNNATCSSISEDRRQPQQQQPAVAAEAVIAVAAPVADSSSSSVAESPACAFELTNAPPALVESPLALESGCCSSSGSLAAAVDGDPMSRTGLSDTCTASFRIAELCTVSECS